MAWQKHTQWIVRNIRFSMILGMTVPEGKKNPEFCFVQTSSLSGNVGNSQLYYIYI